ncbi:helicase-related protein [Pedobacter montanisoli]|uniref:RNA helicase n=1 Tax=Pedobacter montanisoli TaxID=2923277 RepID=A0ABS9ZWM1_9SPHI|nr:DEAD/DEAH box helicase [Pedobacter montanisoli]MCJ0742713.1 DEAD/DEAH box helicase [Pedobacter montanisoli]
MNFKAFNLKETLLRSITGIDTEELSHLVNYELPNSSETYVHKIGRTGNAGSAVVAVSFCDATEEITDLNNIQKLIGFKIPVATPVSTDHLKKDYI